MFRKDPFVTGEYYHLYNRGVDKRVIYKQDKDFERFLLLLYVTNSTLENPLRLDDLLNKQKKTFREVLSIDRNKPLVSIGAWCLMKNHFHILVKQEVDGGISKFMKKLGTGYSMFFNIKYRRTGALFGGLFKSKLVGNDDRYLRHLFGYIHLNPLEVEYPNWKESLERNIKNKKDFLLNYRYSSYQDWMNISRPENNILAKEAFPGYFIKKRDFEHFVSDYLTVNEYI